MRLGIDVGTVRVGVAGCDPGGVLAAPVAVLRRDRAGAELEELRRLVVERDCVEVVVGLPRSLSGRAGPAERAARAYAAGLAGVLAPIPVRLVDERLSTVQATAGLAAAGVRGRRARARVDAAAATVILQAALDAERRTGRPPGELAGDA
ncbi:MAG TPA: Holliday junction resolvase RuvX [Mycobacteriales bacterium]|nr:Holliday junction resolvase RuvX [Mycobacteriales bacterium]